MFIKPIITNVSPTDTRKLCSFSVKNDILGKLDLSTKAFSKGFGRLVLELKDCSSKLMASEDLSLYESFNEITGLNINVEPEYRHTANRNFRLGEILRLATIIEMLENNKNIFKIFSKDTAVYFHSKYKFEPDIKSFDERDKALKTISEDRSPCFEPLALTASDIIEQIKLSKSADAQRAFCADTNKLVKQYIDKSQNNYKAHPFSYGFNMVLTRQNLYKNRSFYNDLYKKYGIDYTI